MSRKTICAALGGDLLEIGPGAVPLATSAQRVKYADRHVGDRDNTWPELAGTRRGPEADFAIDLDASGLDNVPDRFDSVAMSHVIEHVANPIAAIVACGSVLKPGGRLGLFVPDMRHTFDADREVTTVEHVLEEYDARCSSVSDEHIREFCAAIYARPPIHPAHVREWHDPAALTPERLELHRRRSIHVHAWTPHAFWALLGVGPIADRFRVVESFSVDDEVRTGRADEFGCLLEKR